MEETAVGIGSPWCELRNTRCESFMGSVSSKGPELSWELLGNEKNSVRIRVGPQFEANERTNPGARKGPRRSSLLPFLSSGLRRWGRDRLRRFFLLGLTRLVGEPGIDERLVVLRPILSELDGEVLEGCLTGALGVKGLDAF